MKKFNLAALVCGILAFIGTLMPLAALEPYYVSIHHLSGLAYLLYILPLVLIAAAGLALAGKIQNLLAWYLPVGLVGMILAGLTVQAGKSHLNFFSSGFGGFFSNQAAAGSEPGIALGGVLMLLCYATTTALAFSGRMAPSGPSATPELVGQGSTPS